MLTMKRISVAGFLAAGMLSAGACGTDVGVLTPDGSVKANSDRSEVTIKGKDGSELKGGTQLPKDFPKEIPLIEGRVISGISTKDAFGIGFSVAIEVDGLIDDVAASASQQLEAGGFTQEESQVMGGVMAIATFSNATWQVAVTVSASSDADQLIVTYTITPPSS